MYYRITITKNGKHHLSTDAESAPNLKDAVLLYHELSRRFPRSEGFSVMLFEITKQVLVVDPLTRVAGGVA